MIKNIIVDLSEVIISGYSGIEENTNIPAEIFYKRNKETWNIFLDCMRGKYSENEYLEYLLKGMNWEISKEDLKRLIRQCLNRKVEGTVEILQRLKENYLLVLLSDHVKEWMEFIVENNREINLFKYKYFSYEYGKLKTDEGCFEYIVKDLQINPKETIFIDDCQENIDMANQEGIEGIVFKSAKQLENELIKRRIL